MVDICRIENAIGETRAEVLHKNKPVEYYIRRWSSVGAAHAGDIFSGRVSKVDKALMAAFINLGDGQDGLLRFTMSPSAPHLHEGQMLRVKVLRDAEIGKGPLLSYIEISGAPKPVKENSLSLKEVISARYPNITFEEGSVSGIVWAVQEEVALKGGGYIYIEHTRAGTMIDVDTAGGQKTKVSIEAAKEIARQIRLRGIGGLVLIDFPNFRKKKDRADVWQTLKDCFAHDPNSVKIAPFSRFDTVELTRSRNGATIGQILLGPDGQISCETLALKGIRRLIKEARIDGGAKFVLELPKPAYEWLMADSIGWLKPLTNKLGPRFLLKEGKKLDVYKGAS